MFESKKAAMPTKSSLFYNTSHNTKKAIVALKKYQYSPTTIANLFLHLADNQNPFIFTLIEREPILLCELVEYAFSERRAEFESKQLEKKSHSEYPNTDVKFRVLLRYNSKTRMITFLSIISLKPELTALCLEGLTPAQKNSLLSKTNDVGFSYFHYAFRYPSSAILEYGIEQITKLSNHQLIRFLSARCNHQRTPLRYLADSPYYFLDYLPRLALSSELKIRLLTLKDSKGNTIIHALAKSSQEPQVVQDAISVCLAELADMQRIDLFRIQNAQGSTVLHLLAAHHPQYIQQLLINCRHNNIIVDLLSVQNNLNDTVLHLLMRYYPQGMIRFLRENLLAEQRSYLLSIQNIKGFTVLHELAIEFPSLIQQCIEIVPIESRYELLSIETFSDDGFTPVMKIAERSSEYLRGLLANLPPEKVLLLLCQKSNDYLAWRRPFEYAIRERVDYAMALLEALVLIDYSNADEINMQFVIYLMDKKDILINAAEHVKNHAAEYRELIERMRESRSKQFSLLNLVLRYKRYENNMALSDATKSSKKFAAILRSIPEPAMIEMDDFKQLVPHN